ncbi:glycosyltransferase family 2 protein [Methanobrevibacter acididurans]|uniref:glycosyltransferase family 2 protein n=1 Tax=Methanobrevibacter acididurans TaxID=120963 RepID=UPI0038FD1E30
MSKYKLSVIIPTFNTGVFLHESLGSIINQSIGFENVEVILVDDKSSDPLTLSIIDDYVSKYSNIKVIYLEENSGFPGRPRNVGINASTSDYVIVMDHDDNYEIDAFEHLYNTITKENADMVSSNYFEEYNGIKEKHTYIFGPDFDKIKISSIDEDLRFFDIGPAIWIKLFRKSFLKEHNIRFLEGMLAEDLNFFINVLLQSKSIVYLDNYFGYNYKIRDTDEDKSTIHVRNKKYLGAMISGYYETWDMLKNLNQEKYFSNVFRAHLVFWLTSFIASNISNRDKKDLAERMGPILNEQLKYTPDFGEIIYIPLVKPLKDNNFDEFVKASNNIKKSRKRRMKIKNFIHKLKI